MWRIVLLLKGNPKNHSLLRFELQVKSQGYRKIGGVDEVGRGCLAGPVVAACVILPWEIESFPGVFDSKQLTPLQRENCFDLILEKAIGYGVGFVEAEEIDQVNILQASLKAMVLAIQSASEKPDFLLVDGREKISTSIPQQTVIKGDTLSLSIAAAPIVAKVTRDRLMTRFAQEFPQFGFEKHKGYGTEEHFKALKEYGPTAIHRLSFKGVV